MKEKTKLVIATSLLMLVLFTTITTVNEVAAPYGSDTFKDEYGNKVYVRISYTKYDGGNVKVTATGATTKINIGYGGIGFVWTYVRYKVYYLYISVKLTKADGTYYYRTYTWKRNPYTDAKRSKTKYLSIQPGIVSIKVTGKAKFQAALPNGATLPYVRSTLRIYPAFVV